MQTQRDHVHAHQFQMGRMSAALVLGDPTSAEDPGRRSMVGLLVGILIGVLIVAGFLVYGWLVPGGSKVWRQPGTIIVEKETGNRYVYLDGVLRPTLNITSAMLVQGPQATIRLVSGNSLKGVPRGGAIGIPEAPQTVPGIRDVVPGPWLACLPGSVSDAKDDSIGLNLDPQVPAEPLADDRFVLVSEADRKYLLWRGAKHPITDDAALVALGATNVKPVHAPKAWLDQLPKGPSVTAAKIGEAGAAGPSVDGQEHRIGQLFRQRSTNGGDDQLFVLRSDGLSPVSRTQFMLLEAKARTNPPIELNAAAVAAAPRSGDRSLVDALAALAPARWEDGRGRVLCQRQRPEGLSVSATLEFVAREHAGLRNDGKVRVHARPGSGMVVYPVPLLDRFQRPELYLVSDEGKRYRVPQDQALSALKLDRAPKVPFPRSLLGLVPDGPALTSQAITVTEEG